MIKSLEALLTQIVNAIKNADSKYVNVSGDTMTGNLVIKADEASDRAVTTRNTVASVDLRAGYSKNHGVYSNTRSKWLIYCDKNGAVFLDNILMTPQSTTLSLSNMGSGATLHLNKFGKVVEIRCGNSTGFNYTSAKWYTLGTLPSGYRPKEQVDEIVYDNDASSAVLGILRITTAGVITLYPYSTGTRRYFIHIVFIIP